MKPTNRLPALAAAVILACASAAALLAPSTSAYAQATPAQPAAAPAAPAAPEATKPATPAPPPGAGMDVGTQKEIIENPYGLEALWKQGDFV